MIHRISDSVEITYSFRGNKDGKPAVPADYCLCINTGRDSFEGPQTPVPDIEQITNLVEAYRYEFTQLLHGRPDRFVELRHSIERKLLNYFPIPEFMTYGYRGPLLCRSQQIPVALVVVPYIRAQQNGWQFVKDDPSTKKHDLEIAAESFDQTADGHTKYLHNMTARLYEFNGKACQTIHSKEAVVNFDSGTLAYRPQLKAVLRLKR